MEINMEWKTVPGFESYECSCVGKIRRVDTQKEIARTKLNSGYFGCTLHHQGRRWSTTVHRVIATTFLGDPLSEKHEVNHKNGIKDDNRAENLEWVTHSQNEIHRRVDLKNRGGRLNEQTVREIVKRRNETGESHKSLALRYGVAASLIGHIFTGRAWWHLWPNGKPDCKLTGLVRNQHTAKFKTKEEMVEAKKNKLKLQLAELERAA